MSADDDALRLIDGELADLISISPDDDALATIAGEDILANLISPDDDALSDTVLLRNSNHVDDVILPLDEARKLLTSGPFTLIVTPFMR